MPSNGEQLKLEGLARVLEANGPALAQLRMFAVCIARMYGIVSVDDLRQFAADEAIVLSSPNAWGGVFRDARFVFLDHQKSTYPSNHARLISRYVLAERY